MRVLFWGTPDFSVPSLRALTEEGHEVIAAVTQPDRPAGRGRALRAGAVKRECEALGIPVLQPVRAGGEDFLRDLERLRPDVSIVVAYGQILPGSVLSVPRHGSLNLHASLLPELRGAAPLHWAILNGHTRSGVTVMRMVREMDAGPILYQIPIDLAPDLTVGDLHELLSELGAEALVEALTLLVAGRLEEREQDEARATYAPKLARADARLDWSRPARELERWIRGCDPRPGAWSRLSGAGIQLFQPALESPGETDLRLAEPGRVLQADPRSGLLVAAGTGALRIREVKPAGRSRMSSAAWIRGRGIAEGARFE
ncbi:MAG: methionyl-tRNA formyltransferase [Gemmatimonadota bacterium]